MSKRQRLWLLLALASLLMVGLLASRVERLTEGVWTVELSRGCSLDYHTSGALALACKGVDYTRLWPLPVEQPWEEPEKTPKLHYGQMASVADAPQRRFTGDNLRTWPPGLVCLAGMALVVEFGRRRQ